MIERYGKSKYKKKRKHIPSHFATQKKAGANPFTSYAPYKKKAGASFAGFRWGDRLYRPKSQKGPVKKKAGASKLSTLKMRMYGKKAGSSGFMRRVKPYTKIKRKKTKNPGKRPRRISPYARVAGSSVSGCRMGKSGNVTGCHFTL